MHIVVTFYGSLKCFALIKVMCFDTALLKDVYKGIHLFSIYFWPAAEKNGLKGSLCKLFGIQYIPLSMQTFTLVMMTSSNGNIFRVTGPLCGEFTGPRWIPLTKASDAELWCFRWSATEQTETSVIWDAIAPIMTSQQCFVLRFGTGWFGIRQCCIAGTRCHCSNPDK